MERFVNQGKEIGPEGVKLQEFVEKASSNITTGDSTEGYGEGGNCSGT